MRRILSVLPWPVNCRVFMYSMTLDRIVPISKSCQRHYRNLLLQEEAKYILGSESS